MKFFPGLRTSLTRRITGFYHCIDRFIVNENGIYLSGWAFAKNTGITGVHLSVSGKKIHNQNVKGNYGKNRPDVGATFPGFPHALNSGFLLFGPSLDPLAKYITVIFPTNRKRHRKIILPVPEKTAVAAEPEKVKTSGRDLLKLNRIKSFRYRECLLVIDHSMGGGSNIYRNNLISEQLNEGDLVVLLTFSLFSMSYRLVFQGQNVEPVSFVRTQKETIFSLLSEFKPHQIFANGLVSFPDTPGLLSRIEKIRKESNASLTIAVHDYFPVCPSQHLLNPDVRFCGLPEITECRKCLSANNNGFIALTNYISPENWRMNWEKLMTSASEVRCFSESSVRLLSEIYPGLKEKMIVRKHRVEPLRKTMSPFQSDPVIRVAVIGAIPEHKGAKVLTELTLAIHKNNAPVQIIIIGTAEISYQEDVVKITGTYRREELPEIIEKNRITFALMPSVCPETFSFVTHEVISMGLPLITFDLGAQCETAQVYPLGRCVRYVSGDILLDDILSFATFIKSKTSA